MAEDRMTFISAHDAGIRYLRHPSFFLCLVRSGRIRAVKRKPVLMLATEVEHYFRTASTEEIAEICRLLKTPRELWPK